MNLSYAVKKTLGTPLAAVVMTACMLPGLSVAAFNQGEDTTVVGGEEMFPAKDIIDNAVNSKDHTTLVAAVKAAGLVETLKTKGPFTVFAPTNDAFENLPDGTVETLLKPESKATLTKVLTYHVIAANLDLGDVLRAINANGGSVALDTVAGDKLTFTRNGNNVVVKDAKGGTANIVTYDVYQSNGVIHVIDKVLLP